MTQVCKSCGQPIKGRSHPDHRRLFALIQAAYDQWPETAHFQPINAEHLRSWLICSAGPEFRRVNTFDLDGVDDKTRALVLSIMKDEHTHGGIKGDLLYKVQPTSMKFDKMAQKQFAALRQAIEDVIEQTLGVSVDDLLKEKAA